MPQQKQISWAQLRVGILVIVSLSVLTVGIFFISGQVGFLSRRYALKTYFSSAGGVREGAEVRLAGIPVGNVEKIRISPFPDDPARAVEIEMRIAKAYQDQIRGDSVATIATAGLLGEGYVEITRGSRSHSMLQNSGVLKSREEADIKQIVQNTNDVISNLRVLSAKLNDITNQIQKGQGTMGKLIYDQALYNRFNETTGAVQRLVSRVERGEGSLGKLMADETIYQRTVASIDRLNQILDDVQHGKGSMALFINDSSLYKNASEMVAKTNTLVDNINKGQGTLGKLATDPQLYTRMNETVGRLDTLTMRIEQGQGTLGKLSTDPTLFNNLNESAKSLRDFLTEFRKEPKKYLTIRVRLF